MLAGDVSVLVLLVLPVLLSNPLFKPVRAGLEVCVGCWILESPPAPGPESLSRLPSLKALAGGLFEVYVAPLFYFSLSYPSSSQSRISAKLLTPILEISRRSTSFFARALQPKEEFYAT